MRGYIQVCNICETHFLQNISFQDNGKKCYEHYIIQISLVLCHTCFYEKLGVNKNDSPIIDNGIGSIVTLTGPSNKVDVHVFIILLWY
jgi:hypothetical protein